MTLAKCLAAAAVCAFLTTSSIAQQSPPSPAAAPLPYGAPITLEMAKKAMAAAEAEAVKNNWPVAIAVVDSGGSLVMLHRLDNTQLASIRIAEGKARSALEFRRPTKALEDAIAGGGAGVRLVAIEGIMPLEGGVLIQGEGKIIGAVGVSGVTSAQDAQVAQAGADATRK